MASRAKRVTPGKYPKQPWLGRTYRRRSVSLEGARSFLAAEGLIVTAKDRNALASAGGRVWLRPSAARRLGNYLDMTPPMVGGWTIKPSPIGTVLSAEPGTVYDRFLAVTDQIVPLSGDRMARLRSPVAPDPTDRFDGRAVLSYESLFTIEGGERLMHEPDVRLYFLRGGHDTAHVVAIMRRDEERGVVASWLQQVAATPGLHVAPVRIRERAPERHDDLQRIFERLGDLPLRYRHPEVHAAEGQQAPKAAEADYFEYKRSGSDRTWMLDFPTVRAGAEQHNMRIGAVRAFLWAPRDKDAGRDEPSINEIRLSQKPSDEDMLLVSWKQGKLTTGGRPTGLTDQQWDELTMLDWDEEGKRAYLLDIWRKVADLPARGAVPAEELKESA